MPEPERLPIGPPVGQPGRRGKGGLEPKPTTQPAAVPVAAREVIGEGAGALAIESNPDFERLMGMFQQSGLLELFPVIAQAEWRKQIGAYLETGLAFSGPYGPYIKQVFETVTRGDRAAMNLLNTLQAVTPPPEDALVSMLESYTSNLGRLGGDKPDALRNAALLDSLAQNPQALQALLAKDIGDLPDTLNPSNNVGFWAVARHIADTGQAPDGATLDSLVNLQRKQDALNTYADDRKLTPQQRQEYQELEVFNALPGELADKFYKATGVPQVAAEAVETRPMTYSTADDPNQIRYELSKIFGNKVYSSRYDQHIRELSDAIRQEVTSRARELKAQGKDEAVIASLLAKEPFKLPAAFITPLREFGGDTFKPLTDAESTSLLDYLEASGYSADDITYVMTNSVLVDKVGEGAWELQANLDAQGVSVGQFLREVDANRQVGAGEAAKDWMQSAREIAEGRYSVTAKGLRPSMTPEVGLTEPIDKTGQTAQGLIATGDILTGGQGDVEPPAKGGKGGVAAGGGEAGGQTEEQYQAAKFKGIEGTTLWDFSTRDGVLKYLRGVYGDAVDSPENAEWLDKTVTTLIADADQKAKQATTMPLSATEDLRLRLSTPYTLPPTLVTKPPTSYTQAATGFSLYAATQQEAIKDELRSLYGDSVDDPANAEWLSTIITDVQKDATARIKELEAQGGVATKSEASARLKASAYRLPAYGYSLPPTTYQDVDVLGEPGQPPVGRYRAPIAGPAMKSSEMMAILKGRGYSPAEISSILTQNYLTRLTPSASQIETALAKAGTDVGSFLQGFPQGLPEGDDGLEVIRAAVPGVSVRSYAEQEAYERMVSEQERANEAARRQPLPSAQGPQQSPTIRQSVIKQPRRRGTSL